MALHPGPMQVLLKNVTEVSPRYAIAENPDAKLRAGEVVELGVMQGFALPYGPGDTVYFNAGAPLINWPNDLAQIPLASIISWADAAK